MDEVQKNSLDTVHEVIYYLIFSNLFFSLLNSNILISSFSCFLLISESMGRRFSVLSSRAADFHIMSTNFTIWNIVHEIQMLTRSLHNN